MAIQDDFTGYRCWDENYLGDMLKWDAGEPSDAILFATHSPALITSGEGGPLINEMEVLTRFLEEKASGINILPILGKAGSGKSHVVRWLRPYVEKVDKAFVVYIRRDETSLRGLITGVLDALEKAGVQDEVTDLREKLSDAHDQTLKEGSENTVLNRISEQLETISKEKSDDATRPGLAELLPPLIRDEAFRIPLKKEDGVVSRFVKSVMEEGEVNLDGAGFTFSEEDFPSSQQLVGHLGEHAQNAFNQVNHPDFKSIAASLINEAFERSIPLIFGFSGQMELGAVFRSARKLLLSQGRTLYVLIEDLSSMKGFETGLLDSFVELPNIEGEKILCNLHVVIATTTGFYDSQLPESIKTRIEAINHEHSTEKSSRSRIEVTNRGSLVHVGVDSANLDSRNLSGFSSRYLNAVRVGQDAIENGYESGVQLSDQDWVPNPCNECVHVDKCHSAFGEIDGVGLYPFNENALNAFYLHKEAEYRQELSGQFNPRKLISEVLYPVLMTASEKIPLGEFPPNSLIRNFKHSPPLGEGAVISIQENTDDKCRERRDPLLRFWGGAPSEAGDLHPGIHVAFAIPEIGKGAIPPSGCKHGLLKSQCQDSECVGEREPSTSDSVKPPSGHPLVEAVKAWVGGERLVGGQATKVIAWLEKSVKESIDWHGLGVPMPGNRGSLFIGGGSNSFLRQFSFHIEESRGVQKESTKITRDLKRAEHGGLLLQFAKALAQKKGAVGLGLDGYVSLVEYVDDVTSEVSNAIQEFVWSDDDDSMVRVLAERLALGGLAAGGDESDLDSVGLVKYVTPNVGEIKLNGAGRWPKLVSILDDERSLQQKELLNMNRTTQSDFDDKSTLRTGRIIFHLQKLATTWEPIVGPLSGQPKVVRMAKKDLIGGVKERLGEVVEAVEDLKALLGSADTWEKVESEINDAMVVATQAGINEDFGEVYSKLILLKEYPPISSYQNLLEGSVSSGANVGENLLTIGNSEKLHPVELHQLLERVSGILSQVIRNGEQRLGNIREKTGENSQLEESPLKEFKTTVQKLLETIGELQ